MGAIKLVLLAFVVFLSQGFSARVDAQQPDSVQNPAGEILPSDVMVVERAGTKKEFDTAWNAFVGQAKAYTSIQGRVLIRSYSPNAWAAVSKQKLEPNESGMPRKIYLADICADFVEMRIRQDWVGLTVPSPKDSVDFEALFSVDRVPLFRKEFNELTEVYEMHCVTLDNQISRVGDNDAEMSLPKPRPRLWPNVVDWRIAGWVSIEQWIQPTSLEQWLQILAVHAPVAIAKVNDRTCRLTLEYRGSEDGKSSVFQFDLDPENQYRLLAVYEYDGLRPIGSEKIRFLRSPKFQSRLYYDADALKSVIVARKDAEVHRLDFLSRKVNEKVDDERFVPRDFLEGGVGLIVKPDLQEVIINNGSK